MCNEIEWREKKICFSNENESVNITNVFNVAYLLLCVFFFLLGCPILPSIGPHFAAQSVNVNRIFVSRLYCACCYWIFYSIYLCAKKTPNSLFKMKWKKKKKNSKKNTIDSKTWENIEIKSTNSSWHNTQMSIVIFPLRCVCCFFFHFVCVVDVFQRSLT